MSSHLILTAGLVISASSFAADGPCPAPVIHTTETDAWTLKVVAGLIGEDVCYADKSAFENSDCNIFAGRVLEQAYKIGDFVLKQPKGKERYETSNEIARLVILENAKNWELLGAMNDQEALNLAAEYANQNRAVIAVWYNRKAGRPGHVALVGPGPLTVSTSLKLQTPVSASFFQGEPKKNYFAKPLACAFGPDKVGEVRLYVYK